MKYLVLFLLFLSSSVVHAVGIKRVEVPADKDGSALDAVIWTPCAAEAGKIQLGPYELSGRRNCPTEGDKLPLVVISHGHGGSNLGHHDLARTLADAGFVVAAVNHPGDNYADMSKAGEVANFLERPRDIKRLIDYMLSSGPDASRIDRDRIGFFGFSRGGYTGLVLAGANPDFINSKVPCDNLQIPLCARIQRKEAVTGPFLHETRIKAFVLADPLNVFPAAVNLEAVRAPLQVWASEDGGDGVLPGSVAALADALPEKPEFHPVPGAGHFAFLAPCSAELTKFAPDICIDKAGFDRSSFHRQMNESVVAFFKVRL